MTHKPNISRDCRFLKPNNIHSCTNKGMLPTCKYTNKPRKTCPLSTCIYYKNTLECPLNQENIEIDEIPTPKQKTIPNAILSPFKRLLGVKSNEKL